MGCGPSQDAAPSGNNSRAAKSLYDREKEVVASRSKDKLMHNLVNEVFTANIRDNYEIEDEGPALGTGTFAVVRKAVKKSTKRAYAVKIFRLKKTLEATVLETIMAEVNIMKKLNHPNIIRLQEVYQEDNKLFLVMDLATGGDVFGRYASNKAFFAKEANAASIMLQVTKAVRYCHSYGVVHRDIKLENLLYEDEGEYSEIKLMDFGLSTLTDAVHSNNQNAQGGTVDYMSPEQIKGKGDKPCDMWAIGILTYVMLAGYFPFNAATSDGVKLKIKWGGYSMPKADFAHVSAEGKDFISKLLTKDADKRLTATEAMDHPWLKMSLDAETHGPVSEGTISQFKKFGEKTGIYRLALEVIAHHMDSGRLAQLSKEFQKFDKDGSGLISEDEFVARLVEHGTEEEEAKALFASADVDGSKEIQLNEFLAAAMDRSIVTEKAVEDAFARLDTEQRGVLTVEGLRKLVGTDIGQDELAQALSDMAGSSDEQGEPQQVTLKEFRSAMAKNVSFMDLSHHVSSESLAMAREASKDAALSEMPATVPEMMEEGKEVAEEGME